MKVLFNCSINVVGGAVQNAANFIKYASQDSRFEYLFIVSPQVFSLLERWNLPLHNVTKVASPSKELSTIDKVKLIEKEFKPEVVYTMAGPTYIKFKSRHVLGISDPYITHASLDVFFKNRSFYEAVKHLLRIVIKAFRARIEGDYFIFQTETSRNGFCKRFFANFNKTSVIPNALGEHFLKYEFKEILDNSSEYQVLYPSAYYPHKNMEQLTSIIDILRKSSSNIKIIFLLTVAEGSPILRIPSYYFNPDEKVFIKNLKPFSYADAVEVYKDVNLVFFPSLLETFSTSYLEAMIAKKNLLVADMPFSREICKKYAYYYNAFSPEEAASKISELIAKNPVYNQCLAQSVLNEYGSQKQRYQKIASLILEKGKRNG